MKMIIISLIIGVLFASSEAERYNVKSPINEESRYKRSMSADILIDLSGISEIEITSKYSAHEGLKATCKATGENLSYKWAAKIGNLLSNEMAEGNVLSINQVTMENDREFCCSVSNTVETIEKCKRLGPLIVSSDPLERTVDSSAEMFCEVFGIDDHFDIKWERTEGLPLPNNAIVNDGHLKIPKLARTDTGNYTCIGSMHGKTAFHQKISLKVVAPPEIVELRSAGLDGEYDNNVTIQCITLPDETITYKWKTQTEGRTDLRENEKAEDDLLSIYNFKKDNEGTFCCVATNALGTREKCVTIESPIFEVYPKESQEVMSGSTVTLECRGSTGSSDMKIDWARGDGHQFTPNVSKLAKGTLIIRNIAIEDEGRYDCFATKGVLSTSATTVIKVKTLPVVKISNNDENKIAKLGDKVELSCTADGHPQPNVQWQKFSLESQSYQTVKPATLNSAVYEIKGLSEKEAGLYLCLAENSAGSTKETVQVVIKPPVLEVYPKESHEVMSGSTITLECLESAGYLNMKIDWARENDQSLSPNAVKLANGSLTITNIRLNDEGRYKCSATNGIASASTATEIKVKTLPVVEIISSNDGSRTAKLGDKVELKCTADGKPQPNVQWQKFSSETNSYQIVKPATLNSAVYEMKALSEKEAGLYLCLAENSAGSTKKTVQVVIKPPVLEVYPKESHEVMSGSTITLECLESAGYSNMKIDWARENDQSLSPNAVKLANGSLTITNIRINDEGRYKCSATNGIASASTATEIKVKTLPVVEIISSNDGSRTAKLGDKVELKCTADGKPQPNVQWQKFLSETNSYQIVKPATLNSAVYEIKALSEKEAGLYLCLAENSAGTTKKTVQVVTKPPVLEVYPKESHEVMSGSTITLECLESAGYLNMKIDWARENDQSLSPNAVKLANGSLTITNIRINDEGRYECSATNGIASASTATEIKVKTLPVVEIISSNDGSRTANLGDKVELKCTADGKPQPNVQWQKFSSETNSYQIVKPATLNSAVYEIKALSEKEAGLYLCLAENSAGSTKKTVQVVIKPLVLEVFPKELDTVMSGSSVTLECRELAKYPNVKIDWTREDGQAFAPNFAKLANGSLRITNITTSDSGRYKCSAKKEMLSSSATADIDVKLSPPSEIKIETRFYDDTHYRFICHATGEKISYHWTAQSRKLWWNERAEGNELAFVGATKRNDGTFCCQASNGGGNLRKCVPLPTTVTYPVSHICLAGETIDIPCEVFGQDSSKIYVQWLRGNSVISGKSLGAATARLPDLATGTDDLYSCQGLSSDGTEIFRSTTQFSVESSFWCKIFSCQRCRELQPNNSHIWFANRRYHK